MHLLDHHDDVNIPKQQMNHLIGNDASNTVEMQEKLNKFKVNIFFHFYPCYS